MTVQNTEFLITVYFDRLGVIPLCFFAILKRTECINFFTAIFIWHFSCQLCFMHIHHVNHFCVGTCKMHSCQLGQNLDYFKILASDLRLKLSHKFCRIVGVCFADQKKNKVRV